MKSSITSQINAIDRSLAWIKQNCPEHYRQRFMQLVKERCRLRRLLATEDENPAIAAYGESQKGKSYVITNLLSDSGRPFTVKANGREYDFVKEINPITRDVEATGIVTRFTTFGTNPSRYNEQYPVLVKLLGVCEIATILCDGYHSDITDYRSYSDDELRKLSQTLIDRYAQKPEIEGSSITEDDVMEMKEYLRRCTGSAAQALLRSPYLDDLAFVARRIPSADWNDAFSPLWHENPVLTRLFSRLTEALGRLNYTKSAYLPIEAVLNNNLTLMSVQRINELGSTDRSQPGATTDVLIIDQAGNKSMISNFDKSELSALCAEAVFKVEDRFLNSTLEFDLTMVDDPETRNLLGTAPFSKNIIAKNDLLDFPGARARNQLKEENLEKTDTKSSMANDANVFLRGKVAYLFNRYSDNGMINILLFCHDHAQRSDDTLYLTVENWVKQYVGDTTADRAQTLKITGGISPFFLVATKFNIDMAMGDPNPDDVTNSRNAIDQRWHDRFNIVFYKELLHGNDADWFRNWVRQGESFHNTYLLRDYKYSGDTGKGNNLYNGFASTGRETESAMPGAYYSLMRQSFIESPYVQRFFDNPTLSWDAAATINNDGALLLFRNLDIAAGHMRDARRNINENTLKQVGKSVYEIIKDYFHTDDAAQQLINDMNRACAIRREIIFAANADNYFFGRLIQTLQTSEKQVYNCVYNLLNSTELNADVNSFDNYELLRKDIGHRLDRCSADNDNAQKWECLMIAWGLPDRAAVEDYLAKRGVKPEVLFNGSNKRRQNSAIIAAKVFDQWEAGIKSPQLIAQISENGNFDPIELTALIENILLTAKNIGLVDLLEKRIEEFVNVMNVSSVNISTVSDLMASAINGFVADLGFSMRTDGDIAAVNRIIDDNPMRFDPLTHLNEPEASQFDEDSLTDLFNKLYNNPEAVTPAFEQNYYRWIEFMIVSFLLKGHIVDYDVAANKRLGEIINQLK